MFGLSGWGWRLYAIIFVSVLFSSCGERDRKTELRNRRIEAESAQFDVTLENRTEAEITYSIKSPDGFLVNVLGLPEGIQYIDPTVLPVPQESQGKNFFKVRRESEVMYQKMISACSKMILTGTCDYETVYRKVKLQGP